MSLLFWNVFATRYAKSPIANEDAYQKKLQVTRGYFRPSMKVLEFGCGTGSTAIAHAPHVQHIHAVDFSSKMLQIARDKAAAQHIENVTFERASIEGLSVSEQSQDAVLGLSILHLLKNKEAAIAKVHKMLKPGGVFVSSTFCAADNLKFWSLGGFFLYVILPIGSLLRVLPAMQSFSADELEACLAEAGFEIEFRSRATPTASVFIVAKKRMAAPPAHEDVAVGAS